MRPTLPYLAAFYDSYRIVSMLSNTSSHILSLQAPSHSHHQNYLRPIRSDRPVVLGSQFLIIYDSSTIIFIFRSEVCV
jgi:hypothetical protein